MTNEQGSPGTAGRGRDLDRSHRFDEDGTASKARKKKVKKSKRDKSGEQARVESSEDGASRSRRARKTKSTTLEIIRESQASVDEDSSNQHGSSAAAPGGSLHQNPNHQQLKAKSWNSVMHAAAAGTKIEDYLQMNGVQFKKGGNNKTRH